MSDVLRTTTRSAFAYAMSRSGRDHALDPDLPTRYLATTLVRRSAQLLRGFARTRRAVFLGERVRLLNRRAICFGRGVSIGDGTVVDGYARNGVVLSDGSRLGLNCVVTCTSHSSRYGAGFTLGRGSGLGDGCHVGASGGIAIGADVIAGPFVSFHSQEHRFDDPTTPIRLQGTIERGIVVADDCWIGARVTVLDGTTLGAGCVVAAGAVVRGEFPPRSLIGGVPARVLREL